ncbi:hypothetical protein [Shinella zoogloeoides]|uniref:hypothetical protein n=1 Tax=Shinella zoogloeoides TaxID=352475 RepID=UPI0028B264BD|nr:hypothetical protein [Shinella zoogloeoides]
MQTIQAIFEWLMANADTVLAIAFAVEVVAVQIVNLTPTTVDNKVLAVFHKALVFVANIVPNAKTTPEAVAKE